MRIERTPHSSNYSLRLKSSYGGSQKNTAKLPSDTFLWAALGSIGASLVMMAMGQDKKANFIGQWEPTILILGMYNKLVKLHGSDGAA